jgi:4-amino-4-deoxy-L-arabinose transferase-like glycosyltransferase
MPNDGPLAFWIGAILIKLFGWVTGDALAARLSILVFFAIGAASVWRAAFVLGGRSEAQPLKLAFGGQPAALDYGRTLADGALLVYMACLGLLLRSHETATPALHVALVAASFYAAACVFDRTRIKDALLLGATLGLLVLTRGWTVPLGLLMAMLLLAALRYQRVLQALMLYTIPVALLIPLAWVAAHSLLVPADPGLTGQWMSGKFLMEGGPTLANIRILGKTLLWHAWPAWPIALWAIYAWRTQACLHILLPAAGIAVLLLLNLAAPVSRDVDLLPLLPPLAILATFGLPTLKRGAINAIDWFSVMALSAMAAFIWLGWIAKQTGWPAQLAKNAFKLAPGFKPEFNLIALLIALASSVGWVLLLQWRLGRRPPVLWRAVVLSTGGLVLCWLLLMTLWLPWLNYGQSYADVAQQIKKRLPDNYRCVNARGVGPAQRASFAYLGEVQFSKTTDERCEYLLVQDTGVRKQRAQLSVVGSEFTLLWQGRRASDRNESFRLFKRDAP